MFNYNRCTRFEKTRIVSARSLQIAMGAPISIKTNKYDPKKIAKQEADADAIPITIKRRIPGKND